MVDLSELSFFLIVQRSHVNYADDQKIWTPYIDRQYEGIPIIHVRPFEHDASMMDCIKLKDFTKFRIRLKERNYSMMKSTKNNIWYVCQRNIINEKIYEYMLRTKAYIEIENLNLSNRREKVQQLLTTIVNDIEILLKTLCEHELITSFQYHQMNYRHSSVRLDYMLFNPNTCQQEQVVFEPTIISTLSPLMPICRYLHRLLAPIYYNQVAHLTTVTKGADLVQRLEYYQQQGYLQSSTYLITICIRDPYVSITHQRLLQTLKCFLDDYVMDETVQGMHTMAILKLTEFLLQHQYFVYQNCLYRQVTGGGTGLYFMNLLIDIYLFYWQQPLLLYQNQHEIVVRCFSDLFLTWNKSKEKFQWILDEMKKKHPYIQYDINIQTKHIHYLDVQIHSWYKQTLQTEVYHDWKYEPYIMPTMYDTSSFSTWNLIQTALIRAVLCCSQLEDFQHEQQYIEYSFLFNRFSFNYVRQSIEEFFIYFKISDLTIYHDQTTYEELRRYVRQYDQENTEKKMKGREEAQKQCFWYIYSSLKGPDLIRAKQNPKQFLPSHLHDYQHLPGITIEIVGLSDYPCYTS
ncbi:unnamed protein product [Rotaria sordida]|uniref:Uncharacterized protein n=1 Tax=Rotaria sordida TaxID=392033 RepID=A0A819JUD4_9BILA|nr:unnamed protein product [Rotaria sordida]CAF3934766.1 unnamed protein product [Rotaria sordida]